MLIAIFLCIAVLVAAAVCLMANAFTGLTWLWLLPLVSVGVFFLLAALWFLLIVLMAKSVDMEKEQEGDSPIFRRVIRLTVAAVIPILGVRVHTKGFDRELPKGRFLLVCNHLHDIDPAFLLWKFPQSGLAFIAKREVQQMPLVGQFLKKTQGQFVNRENDREALKCILSCIRLVKEDKASIGVFPEGWVSLDRLLHPFRPGVFKIAQKANVPVVVCTLRDTYKVMDKVKKLRRADVHLHLAGIITAEEVQSMTTVDVAHLAHKMMAEDLGSELVLPAVENT